MTPTLHDLIHTVTYCSYHNYRVSVYEVTQDLCIQQFQPYDRVQRLRRNSSHFPEQKARLLWRCSAPGTIRQAPSTPQQGSTCLDGKVSNRVLLFGFFKGVSKSVQVLFHGEEASKVVTLTSLKQRAVLQTNGHLGSLQEVLGDDFTFRGVWVDGRLLAIETIGVQAVT